MSSTLRVYDTAADPTNAAFTPHASKGGDIVFVPGRGWAPSGREALRVDGAIIFKSASGEDMLRLCADGRIIVRGESVADNTTARDGFIEWLRRATFDFGEGEAHGDSVILSSPIEDAGG